MLHRTLASILMVFGLNAYAQTIFIPDTVLRVALNSAKPNSVDANGMCDTAAWNAQPPSTLLIDLFQVPSGASLDLEGIQYLKIGTLDLENGLINQPSVQWSGYPLNMTKLILGNVVAGLFTGAFLPFPPSLNALTCFNCGLGTIPPFSGTWVMYQNEDLSGPVIDLPPTLTNLNLINCNLSTLSALPNLTDLNLRDNPLGYLPTLPSGLLFLTARNCDLNSLQALPAGLIHLDVTGNSLNSLPALPSTLQHIIVGSNQITSLPPVPPWLNTLDVSNNPLPVLPLINSVSTLSVASCGMSVIDLPNGVGMSLNASNNPITSVPNLGSGIKSLSLANCSLLTCLPPLPSLLTGLYLTGSGVTCLPNIPPGLNTSNLGIAAVVCDITNSPCPPTYPVITGTTFEDANSNGIFESSEQGRPNSMVVAQPGDLLTASDMNGNYVMPADFGSFSVTGLPGLYESVTTAPYAVTISSIGQVADMNDIGFLMIPGMVDLVTTVTGTNVRPGFNTQLWVHVKNVGTQATDAAVQVTFDPALAYVGSNIVPQSINSNVLDWTMPALPPGGTWSVQIGLYASPSLLLGTAIVQSASATPSQSDQTPADNIAVLNDVVVGSFDPNDKRVEPELLMLQDVVAGTRLDYTIRFQNTGTFPAERVLITDTLPDGLQAVSMQFIGSSHDCTWYIKQHVLHVLFNNINLPDSTNDEANSHGYVRFAMKPSSDLLIGDAVANVANIYFDFNEPVITEPAIFYVETSLSTQEHEQRDLRAWPNPASGQLMVEFDCEVPLGALSVLDLQGRLVLHVPVVASERQTVDVTGIAPGAYLLIARTVNGRVSTRFVKQ